jgi:hypothetical protein
MTITAAVAAAHLSAVERASHHQIVGSTPSTTCHACVEMWNVFRPWVLLTLPPSCAAELLPKPGRL